MRERLATGAAVALVVVLVVVLGGIALRRVAATSADRRNAAPAGFEDEVPAGPGPTDDVALVGDSITEQTEGVFHEELDESYRVRVRGRGGYRVEEMEPYAIELSVGRPEQVVINLGTNDVLTNWPVGKSLDALQRMIRQFDEVRCLHIVNLNEHFFNENDAGVAQRAALFNLQLDRIAKEQGIKVIDWAGAIADDKAAGSPRGELLSDTIHPTELGEHILADLYHASLDTCTA